MGYLFVAYLVLWGLTFGYVFALAARSKRLERDLKLLTRRSDDRSTDL